MEPSTFTTLQSIAARMQDFLTQSDTEHLSAEKAIQVREVIDSMWMKYHDGDEPGAMALGQQLLGFLETTETLVDQAQEEQSVAILTDSLQDELQAIKENKPEWGDFWNIFFWSLFLFAIGFYLWTWWDTFLIICGIGVIGLVVLSLIVSAK
jgi:hypothetical protein